MCLAFSSLGAAYLTMLFVPNLLWARVRRPEVDPILPEECLLLDASPAVSVHGTAATLNVGCARRRRAPRS